MRVYTDMYDYALYIYIAVAIHTSTNRILRTVYVYVYTQYVVYIKKSIYDTYESLDLYDYRTFYVFVHYHYLLYC